MGTLLMNEDSKFSKEEFLKKIQEGDNTLLVVGAIMLLIPVLAIFFLTGGVGGSKKVSREAMRGRVQRKNVFNFGTKNEKGGYTSAPRSGSSSPSSGWFTARTPEQQVADELAEAMKEIEKNQREISVPSNLEGHAREMYVAEHNYNLRMANGCIESGNFALAEEYLKKALEEAQNNVFLRTYALGSLCALYESKGDRKKMEEAYKLYIESVSDLPEEYGGGDLKSIARNAYQAMKSLSKDADQSKVASGIANDSVLRKSGMSGGVDAREVFKDFPVKYE